MAACMLADSTVVRLLHMGSHIPVAVPEHISVPVLQQLVPELVYKPDGVMSCEITPRYVDCILLDRGSDGTEL